MYKETILDVRPHSQTPGLYTCYSCLIMSSRKPLRCQHEKNDSTSEMMWLEGWGVACNLLPDAPDSGTL